MDNRSLEKVKVRFSELLKLRQSWEQQWKEISTYVMPERGFFDGDDADKVKVPNYKVVLDDSATIAVGILSAGLMGGLTPQNKQWFKLVLRNNPDLSRNKNVRLWLDYVEQAMTSVFNYSNVYESLPHVYEECACFGTGAASILEDNTSVIRMRSFTVGEYSLGTDASGRVDTLARSFWASNAQIVEEFGLENVPDSIADGYKNGRLDDKRKLYNLIQRNYQHIEGLRSGVKDKPFVSYFWTDTTNDKRNDGFLAVRGFYEFPFMTPRWKTSTTKDCYGVGCAMRALGNVRTLQLLQADSNWGIEAGIKPALQINSELKTNSPISIEPGSISHVAGQGANWGAKNLYEGRIDLQQVEYKIAQTQARINRSFYADIFLMVAGQGKQMTAKEVAALQSEQLLQLGPVFQKMTTEGTTVLIQRTFNIMLTNNMFPPAPRELMGQDIDVEYIGLLAQAQKAAELNNIGSTMAFAGQIIAMSPEATDAIDFEAAMRTYFDRAQMPADILRSPEEIANIRAQRAQAQAAAQEQAREAQALETAKTLGGIKTDTPNVLTEMAGGAGGGEGGIAGIGGDYGG